MRSFTLIIAVVFLAATLGFAVYSAYSGFGVARAGSLSVRSGSLGGPGVLGGGPGSGK